mmetsp:Transcript_44199/g.95180  ORF Transcript_44199/g.95180 Transcript_44199/m.95180 type:complete len:387 (-) Transcript_44199:145-1305(-)
MRKDLKALKAATPELRGDKDFVLKWLPPLPERPLGDVSSMIKYVSEELRDDEEVMLRALHHSNVFGWCTPRLRQDRDFVLEAVKLDPSVVHHVADDLARDREIALAAVKQGGWRITEHLTQFPELWSDRELALEALQSHSESIEFFSEELLADAEVMLEAVKTWSSALGYADPELLRDRNFMLEAVKSSPTATAYCSKDLATDRNFVLAAHRVNSQNLIVGLAPSISNQPSFQAALESALAYPGQEDAPIVSVSVERVMTSEGSSSSSFSTSFTASSSSSPATAPSTSTAKRRERPATKGQEREKLICRGALLSGTEVVVTLSTDALMTDLSLALQTAFRECGSLDAEAMHLLFHGQDNAISPFEALSLVTEVAFRRSSSSSLSPE